MFIAFYLSYKKKTFFFINFYLNINDYNLNNV